MLTGSSQIMPQVLDGLLLVVKGKHTILLNALFSQLV